MILTCNRTDWSPSPYTAFPIGIEDIPNDTAELLAESLTLTMQEIKKDYSAISTFMIISNGKFALVAHDINNILVVAYED